ncbi:hypothetical protein FQA39_LY01311 [Lamprigera yunnana]|nr:hypothetical protein FQA39_LY01311 [Lamprigera yunnana]
MFVRPKPNETEEEILKQQEDFFKNNIQPSAKLVKDAKETESKVIKPKEDDVASQIANTFEYIPPNLNIGNIVEKFDTNINIPTSVFEPKRWFPEVKRRHLGVTTSKGSIFSQQMKKLKKEDSLETTVAKAIINEPESLPQSSCILTGADKDVIHKENLSLLQQMDHEEIMEEKERLLATTDPAIVSFLRARRKDVVENRNLSIAKQNEPAAKFNITDVEVSKDLLNMDNSDKWLNFDMIESTKLVWMTKYNAPKRKKGDSFEARFDFQGWLLPFSLEITESNRSLYHHGEDPERPGYTLQELFQLSRSNVIQQKIVALNTIANILYLNQCGMYDHIIDLPLEQIFFVIRFCLDDNTPSVLNASMKALRNLFYFYIDEMCLDNLLGFGLGQVQPILPVDTNDGKDDYTINDQQLAETNLIRCLLRTDILQRISYIINTVKPSTETINYTLEILIKLSRDSDATQTQIFSCTNLLESIIKYFVPVMIKNDNSQTRYDKPLIHAIKLLRVLLRRRRDCLKKLIEGCKVMESLCSYLSNESFSLNSHGLKLQIESLHLWTVFVHYDCAIDNFFQLQPIFLRLLDFHVKNTNIATSSYVKQSHVAALLILLSKVFQNNVTHCDPFLQLLRDYAFWKWISQVEALTEFSCGKLQIISSLFCCFIPLFKHNYSNVKDMEAKIESLIDSKGFNIITRQIRNSSNLLNNYEVHKVSANMKSIEAAVWKAPDHIVPIIQTTSCIPFITVLSKLVAECSNKIKLKFINHNNIMNYLKSLNKFHSYHLVSNWFTRIECQLIATILKIVISVQRHIDVSLFYEIAVKSLSIYNMEFNEDILIILQDIVFSTSFYPCELLINNLHISNTNSLLLKTLRNLDGIMSTYAEVFNIKPINDCLSIDVSVGAVIPIDWIYSPIVKLYADQSNTAAQNPKQVEIITNCLHWIYLYESYFPNLAKAVNPTERYCRLACTYLGHDCLFLEAELSAILEACFKLLIGTNEENINFNTPIKGLNNFEAFYGELLDQYQAVSYGNVLFGNFLLLPLVQRHHVKYRKMFWGSEITQVFNVTSEQLIVPLDLLLKPEETDLLLLKFYQRVLVSGRVRKHTVLYTISSHHLQTFLSKKKCLN